jgi:FlaA1/EpsC-like NDP-sugar epimerase
MDNIYKNLRAYAGRAASNVIIKYIFLPENCSIEELTACVELIKENELTACNFQISVDFKEEQLPFADLSAMVLLYSLLTQAGVRLIFFDDLILQRLQPLSQVDVLTLQEHLAEHGLPDVLCKEAVGNEVVVWGTGAQTRLLVDKCQFFSERDIACFIDPRPHRIGQSFMGKMIKSPSSLLESDLPVVIAAVQSAPQIYSQYQELGLPASRLVRQLVI